MAVVVTLEIAKATTIGPLTAAAGIIEPPKVTVRPVHNYLERG